MASQMAARVLAVLYTICQYLANIAKPPGPGLPPAINNRLVKYVSEVFAAVVHRGSEARGRIISSPKLRLHLTDFPEDVRSGKTAALDDAPLYTIVRVGAGKRFRIPLRRRQPYRRSDDRFFVNIDPSSVGQLVVEIWRACNITRRASVTITRQGGFLTTIRNLWHYLRHGHRAQDQQPAQDQLLGAASVPLGDVPYGDTESWYEIWHGRSRPIGLKVGVCFKEELLRMRKASIARKDHQHLAEVFLTHSLETHSSRAIKADTWADCIPPEGHELLHRHLTEGEIRSTAVLYIQAVMNVQGTIGDRVSCSVVRDLLTTLTTELSNSTSDIIRHSRRLLRAIGKETPALVRRYYEKFATEEDQDPRDLESALACCQLVQSLTDTNVISSTYKDIRRCARNRLSCITRPGFLDVTDERFLRSVEDTLLSIARFYLPLNATFERAGATSHTSITIRELDDVFCALVKPCAVQFSSLVAEADTQLKATLVDRSLDMFRVINRFLGSTFEDAAIRNTTLGMADLPHWFGPSVIADWFVLVSSKQARRMESIVVTRRDLDPTDDRNCDALPAVADCYNELFTLWKAVRSSDPSVARAFARSLSSFAVALAGMMEREVKTYPDPGFHVPHVVQGAIYDLLFVMTQMAEGGICIVSRTKSPELGDILLPLKTASETVTATMDRLRGMLRAESPVACSDYAHLSATSSSSE